LLTQDSFSIVSSGAISPGVRVERIEYERINRLANNSAGMTGNTVFTEIITGFGIAYSGLRNTTIFAGVHRGFAPPRKREANYHRRSLAETGVFRFKTIFTDKLQSRKQENQFQEMIIKCAALNQMTHLGMPDSYKVTV
jgi:outer membrane receptor for Fe3+-dicitrate